MTYNQCSLVKLIVKVKQLDHNKIKVTTFDNCNNRLKMFSVQRGYDKSFTDQASEIANNICFTTSVNKGYEYNKNLLAIPEFDKDTITFINY